MSRHLHRDALRDAGSDEIADGGSAEVVQEATRASSFHAGGSERDPEALDGLARTVEHTRAHDLELSLKILGDRSLLFKHLAQLTRHRERSSLAVLGLSRIEPDFPGAEIDLTPLEWQNLAVNPPACEVRKRRWRSYGFRQMCEDRQELIPLEESDAHVVFLQKRNVRFLNQLPCRMARLNIRLSAVSSRLISPFETPATIGSYRVVEALGIGGLPRGRVVEIYGPESSGKTTLTLSVIAQMQKLGGTAAFIDAEHALDRQGGATGRTTSRPAAPAFRGERQGRPR